MLLDDGYAGVSLREIASRLEISLGNLQYYFPSKDDLVEAVIKQETRTYIDLLDSVALDPNAPGTSIREVVGSLLRYYAGPGGRYYAIMEGLAVCEPRYARLKAQEYDHAFAHMAQWIGFLVPRLPPTRRERLAHVLVALIDGAALQVQIVHPEPGEAGMDALVDSVSAAVEQLLRSWE